MITACTVIVDLLNDYLPIYYESITTRTRLVDEILIVKTDAPPTVYEEREINGIKIRQFGWMDDALSYSEEERNSKIYNKIPLYDDVNGVAIPRSGGKGRYFRSGQSTEHALGLHQCIKKASNDLLLFHDPDVFYYCPVDEFFYNLLNKHNLDAVGISHVGAPNRAYTYFPYLSNMLVKKSSLPPDTYLEGEVTDDRDIIRNGSYMIRTHIPKYDHLFPNPSGDFDTASYLWLWSHLNNWRWVSFQTFDVNTYTTKYYRGSFKFREKFKNQKLLYHLTSCTAGDAAALDKWRQAWEDSKEDWDAWVNNDNNRDLQ